MSTKNVTLVVKSETQAKKISRRVANFNRKLNNGYFKPQKGQGGLMGKVKTEQLDVEVDALLLDEENPRLGAASSQSETLRKLVDLNSNHFRNLMLSIKENGLDPGDSFYVIEHEEDDGDYVVLDGNRRLSALQVLHNPTLLEGAGVDDKTKKRLRKAAEGFNADQFDDPRCVCFENREEANEWIYRRHTRSANGEGRIDWGPLEIARFTNDRSVLDLLAFVGHNADLSDDEWEDKRAFIESKQSSNLERLLTSSAGKQHLGLTHDRSDGENTIPKSTRDPAFLLRVVMRIIDDLSSGVVNSRDLNKASDIEAYFAGLPKNLQPDAKTDKPAAVVSELTVKPAKKSVAKKQDDATTRKRKTRQSKGKRPTLAPRRLAFAEPASEKAAHLLEEATRIQLAKFEHSAAFLLRAFLELTLRAYAKQHKIPGTVMVDDRRVNKSLETLGDEVKKHIIASSSNEFTSNDLRHFQTLLLTAKSRASIQSLNSFVHSDFAIPNADELRSAWEACLPVFVATYGEV
jgi:hypothetical protein